MGFSTTAIHAGNEPDASTGSVSVPIYQTSTYAQDGLGKHKGYEYARTQNPTRSALEKNISALEGAKFGFAFASGMSATDATLKLVKAGDHVILGNNTYGGTFRLFDRILTNYGIEFDLVDTTDVHNVEQAFRENTKMVFVETPTNPVMSLTDLEAVSSLAHTQGAIVVCDNTFMSPYLQRPLELGVDVVVHSTTKYLNGHSDSVGGFVALNDERHAEWIGFVQNSVGAILSPFDSFMVLRGTKTLAVRMDRHNENGQAVANFLVEHPKVEKVYYPGLVSHPQHELAKRQQKGFGGMVSFETGSLENAKSVLESVKVFTLAESLGGVESLISHPATMTHAAVPYETRQELGITDGLVRVSVGIEDIEDLISDLDQALD
ncbi:MAG: cystathionine gamma-synthase [Acidobacteria bacterium]|nr:MAG: cystathionine gamma-synthase [Acidobacteriota bacterium]REK01986.1 MAG: cystathionine gamma-synthase [Acidobacteriota bacterium]REK14943.1 MAG: cystathionine gamma-synthase [Acidobacteriota bacterium]REK45657.1 MAG: cystathionine gamma-synthase [Acidobacteriota bacterium]